jgi:hypothetical protein
MSKKQVELPTFLAKRSEQHPQYLIVKCPREDCHCQTNDVVFLVHAASWASKQELESLTRGETYTITGRSCPYCFRAARLPSRAQIRAGY